jgi:hypothetical protein
LQTLNNETGRTAARKGCVDDRAAQRPANVFGGIAVRPVHKKGHNRAAHPGEKSDNEREGREVGYAGLPTIPTALCSVGLVKPRVIQMQLNQ